MLKGPTYKASLYFQQQLFLKVLRQCGKSFGDQNTIKVFCHPSEKKTQKQKRSVPNPRCRVNFSEWFNMWEKKLDSFARANNVCTCTDCLKQRSRMLWLSRLDWADPAQAWIHTVFTEIDHIFHNKYIFNNKNTFQDEIWPVSCLNDSETQERGL